ncbi:unnamed protein product [Cylicostephanus goldi]|uniref:Uncharacterized protein n=1 Tax=Cylicostephanus goldi TaxID=71465 RepID=A0A3P6TA17_CYLGO|nr:unnamed protein product [Cylicostephanus goldi]
MSFVVGIKDSIKDAVKSVKDEIKGKNKDKHEHDVSQSGSEHALASSVEKNAQKVCGSFCT